MNPRVAMRDIVRRRIRPALISEAQRKFNVAKAWLIEAVESHPISKELQGYSGNSLGSIKAGTLRGFFGFEDGADPVEDLIEFLEDNIEFIEGGSNNARGLINAYIKLPSKDSFDKSDLKLRWENGTPEQSWVNLLESGLSGLEHYIYNGYFYGSRSGEGIQVENQIRNIQFQPKQYLTPLFSEFRKKLIQQ